MNKYLICMTLGGVFGSLFFLMVSCGVICRKDIKSPSSEGLTKISEKHRLYL